MQGALISLRRYRVKPVPLALGDSMTKLLKLVCPFEQMNLMEIVELKCEYTYDCGDFEVCRECEWYVKGY